MIWLDWGNATWRFFCWVLSHSEFFRGWLPFGKRIIYAQLGPPFSAPSRHVGFCELSRVNSRGRKEGAPLGSPAEFATGWWWWWQLGDPKVKSRCPHQSPQGEAMLAISAIAGWRVFSGKKSLPAAQSLVNDVASWPCPRDDTCSFGCTYINPSSCATYTYMYWGCRKLQ